MERWHVPDATALELIEFPGKLGASGKRPRFRFTTRQQRITSYLPEIDAALAAAGKDQAWLHRKIQGRPPLEHIVTHGMEGMAEVLQSPSPAQDTPPPGETPEPVPIPDFPVPEPPHPTDTRPEPIVA
jgi:hypothetical protein